MINNYWCWFYKAQALIDTAECIITCKWALIWYAMNIASLPGIRITSKISLLTATLTDKDNPSSDALLSDRSSNSQETFCWRATSSFLMARRGIYSAHVCLVSKLHNQNANIKWNAHDVIQLSRSLGGEVSIWPSKHIGIIRKYTRIYWVAYRAHFW